MLKRGKDNGHDTWKNVNFQIVFFLIFRNICCRYTLELPLCVPIAFVFLTNEFFTIKKIVSMIRKYHNHKLQTTPWHREEEPLHHHETPGRQIKQSNQLSLAHQDDGNTRMDIK